MNYLYFMLFKNVEITNKCKYKTYVRKV